MKRIFAPAAKSQNHYLFGTLIVEPEGANYRDSFTGESNPTVQQADIITPFRPNFRELVLLQHDGVFLLTEDGELLPRFFVDSFDEAERIDLDPEDQGMKAFNLRSEPFLHRIQENQNVNQVFSSLIHGDPATPVFNVNTGDPITIRLAMPADKRRAHSFLLHNHLQRQQQRDNNSDIIEVQGTVTIGREYNKPMLSGAGGLLTSPGDFMYRSGLIRWDIESGMWGIVRVLPRLESNLLTLNK